jgi:hypothetical protein
MAIIRLSEFQNRLGRFEQYIRSREYGVRIMPGRQLDPRIATHSSPLRPTIYCFHEVDSSETQFTTDFQKISAGNVGGNRLITNFVRAPSGLLDPAGVCSCANVVILVDDTP